MADTKKPPQPERSLRGHSQSGAVWSWTRYRSRPTYISDRLGRAQIGEALIVFRRIGPPVPGAANGHARASG